MWAPPSVEYQAQPARLKLDILVIEWLLLLTASAVIFKFKPHPK